MCQSGAAIAARAGKDEKDALERLMRRSGQYILAAASPVDKALEDKTAQHGIYTRALMEGLAGAQIRRGRDGSRWTSWRSTSSGGCRS